MSERDRSSLNAAEKKYDESFGFDPKPAERKSADESRGGLASAEKSSGQQEKKAIKDTAAGKAAITAAAAGGPTGKIAAKVLSRLRTREGGIGAAIAAIVILISSIGFFSSFLAPIAFVENVIDDLNDQLASLDIRQQHMFRSKVSYDERNKAFKGCTKLSIRCKGKSLSERQVKTFERKGIKVNADIKEFAGVKRYFPKTYSFNGGPEMTPAKFVTEMKTNTALRLAFKRAVNMRFMGLSDNRFLNWTQKKLGISKRKPTLTGTEEERIKKLATLENNRITAETKFIETTDKDGNKAYTIEGGDPNVLFTPDEVASITARYGKLSALAESFTNSKFGAQALKAVSIVGALDMACSVKNMIGMAATMTKVLNQSQTAQYAAQIAALAYAQKASDISAPDSTALNSFFMQTDPRKTLPSVEQTFNDANIVEGQNMPSDMAIKEDDNPYYGKNVMDSPLYKMSSGMMAVASPNATSIKYSLGMGQTTLLAAVGATASIMEKILNLGAGNTGCDIIQNWAVRGISFVIGIIAIIGSAGSSAAANVAVMIVLAAAFIAANAALMSVLTKDIVPEGIEDMPEDKAALTWTGISVIMGASAQSRGMIPASAGEITNYQNAQQASLNDYIAIEHEDSSFFDFSNPYSTTGQTLLALQEFRPSSYTASGILASLSSLQRVALGKPFSSTAMAATATDRFKKCDDPAYIDLNIDADVQCNVRYIMRDSDLSKDPEAVMDYMETNGYVELDPEVGESVTGMPAGYTPPNPEESSNFIKDMASGIENTFYNTRSFGDTPQGQEYGKFLDYCVYRAMPYGNTFEEGGAWGAAEREWITGEKCRSNDEMISNFRVYTMDVTLDDTITEPEDTSSDVVATDGTGLATGTDQQLAKQILGSGKFSGNPKYVAQVQAYARGDFSCHINPTILQLLASMTQKHTIYITSLNRYCTNTLTASGTSSFHWRRQGGHAVDIGIVDGVQSNGGTAQEIAILKEYIPSLPDNSGIGQVQCRSERLVFPNKIRQFDDTCNHTHIEVPVR